MTAPFDAIVAAGSGLLDFSLVIEGCKYVFCTDEAMARTSGGRTWIPGLRRERLGFSERVILQEAEHEATIDEVVIEEVGGPWLGMATEVFTKIAQRITPLTATLGTGTTVLDVADSSLYTVGDYIHLGTETLKVDVIADPTQIEALRAQWDTIEQEHPVTVGEQAQASEVYDNPTGWAFRRCWLRAHAAGELTSDGTVIWRGILAREPALSDDALAWSLAIDPRTKALEAPIAGGFDQPFKLRGIYYPGTAPLYVSLRRHTDASHASAPTDTATILLSGFWETQSEFCIALQEALDAAVSWGVEWDVRSFPDTWDIAVTIAGTPRYISVGGGSDVDGLFRDLTGSLTTDPGPDVPTVPTAGAVPVVSASTTYVVTRQAVGGTIPLGDQRRVPRSNNAARPALRDTEAQIAAFPPTRLYLTALRALSSGDDLTLSPPMVDEAGRPYSSSEEVPSQILRIASVSASTTSLIASEGGVATVPPRIIAAGSTQPSLTGSARYASGDGSVADFRDDLVARGPTVGNRGIGPLTTDDDLADWQDEVVEQAAGRAWLLHRIYTFAKSVKAWDVVREDLKLAGLIPYLDADAKLAVRPLKIDTTQIEYDIGQDEILTDQNLGSFTGEADGIVTVVSLKTGYDPVEDEHQGPDVRFRGISAIARVHAEREQPIEPKSRAVGAEPEWVDISEHARAVVLLYGDRRTQVVRVDVGLFVFGVLCGDAVALTHPALPSDGARTEWTPGSGMIGRRGIVLGREWDMSEGAGSLEVLLHELDVAGYAPCARVTAASGSGTSWTLTCTQSHYSEGDDLSFFANGQAIRIVEWDAGTPTIREGVISGVPTATTVAVTFATSWAGIFGNEYTLQPDTSDDAQTTAAQLEYAHNGNASGRIPLVSGSSPAQIHAP